METLGSAADPVPFAALVRRRDLLAFDGPLLTQFEGPQGPWLALWCDTDDVCHRWLFFRCSLEAIENYEQNDATLRRTILSAPSPVFRTPRSRYFRDMSEYSRYKLWVRLRNDWCGFDQHVVPKVADFEAAIRGS